MKLKLVVGFILLISVGLIVAQVTLPWPISPFGGANTPTGPIQKANCFHSFDGTTTFTCAYSSNVTSGDRLIWAVGNFTGNTITSTTCSDSQGSGTQLGASGVNTQNNNSETWIFSRVASATGANTVSCTFAGSGSYQIGIFEYAALILESCPSVCQFSNANGTGGGATLTLSMTTTTKDLIFVGSGGPASDASFAVTGSMTNEINNNATMNNVIWDQGNISAGLVSRTVSRGAANNPIEAGMIALHP